MTAVNLKPAFTSEDRAAIGRLRADFPTHDFAWSEGCWLARAIDDYDVLIKTGSAAAMRETLTQEKESQ